MFTSMRDSCIRRVRPYVCWTELEFLLSNTHTDLYLYLYTSTTSFYSKDRFRTVSMLSHCEPQTNWKKKTVSTVCTCFAKYERSKAIYLVIIVMIVVLALTNHYFLCQIRHQMSQTRQPGLPAWPPSSTICMDVRGSVMHHAVNWSHAEWRDFSPSFMTGDLVCHSISYCTIFSLLM